MYLSPASLIEYVIMMSLKPSLYIGLQRYHWSVYSWLQNTLLTEGKARYFIFYRGCQLDHNLMGLLCRRDFRFLLPASTSLVRIFASATLSAVM